MGVVAVETASDAAVEVVVAHSDGNSDGDIHAVVDAILEAVIQAAVDSTVGNAATQKEEATAEPGFEPESEHVTAATAAGLIDAATQGGWRYVSSAYCYEHVDGRRQYIAPEGFVTTEKVEHNHAEEQQTSAMP